MRNHSFLFIAILSITLVGCADDSPPPSDDAPEATTVHVTSQRAPELVAYRDGFDAPWQLASMRTPTSADITVHGPYMVTVVCDDGDATRTWQTARTPDDPTDVVAPCDAVPARHKVTGHMVQAGTVHLADANAHSDTPNWDFQLMVPGGSYALIAMTSSPDGKTDDRVGVRRGVAVDGDLEVEQPIDLAAEGTALSGMVFTLENPAQGEAVLGSVELATSASSTPAQLYLGSIAAMKVVPSSAMMTSDVQSVMLQATHGIGQRSLRRPFRIGDRTSFALPESVDHALWVFDNQRLSVALAALPEIDFVAVSAAGSSSDGKRSLAHELVITRDYFDVTHLARPILDTGIPGYKPEWNIDFTRVYRRGLHAQHTDEGALAISATTEQITPPDGSP